MNNNLLVVASTGGMWEISSLISEHYFSGIIGGNKNMSYRFNCKNIFDFRRDLGSAYSGPAYGRNFPPVKAKCSDSSIVDHNRYQLKG